MGPLQTTEYKDIVEAPIPEIPVSSQHWRLTLLIEKKRESRKRQDRQFLTAEIRNLEKQCEQQIGATAADECSSFSEEERGTRLGLLSGKQFFEYVDQFRHRRQE